MDSQVIRNRLEDLIRTEINGSDLGIIPSSRGKVKRRIDTNLFFTLSSALLLKDSEVILASELHDIVTRNLESYRNKYQRPTYNFWRTNPYEQFPNSSLLSRIPHFWIPDDLDCTALSYFFKNEEELFELREFINEHYFLSNLKWNGKHLSGFSTWLGDKMPIEIDICVLSNYLFLLYAKKATLTPEEQALEYSMIQIVKFEDFKNESFKWSPNYQRCSIIYWHLSRWVKNHPVLSADLFQTLYQLLQNTTEFADRIWLELSLSELNSEYRPDNLKDSKCVDRLISSQPFFYASLTTNAKTSWIRKTGHLRVFNIPFCSQAFNASVLLKRISINQ